MVTAHLLWAALREGWESLYPIEGPGHPISCLLPWQRVAGPGVGEGGIQQLLGRRGLGGALLRLPLLLALPASPIFTTGDVPFRQISSLVLDFYRVMARLRCPRTLPWVPRGPISTQGLVPAWGDVAESSKPFAAGLKTPFCFALPAWSSCVTREGKSPGSASRYSTRNKVLPGAVWTWGEVGMWQVEILVLF